MAELPPARCPEDENALRRFDGSLLSRLEGEFGRAARMVGLSSQALSGAAEGSCFEAQARPEPSSASVAQRLKTRRRAFRSRVDGAIPS